MQASSLEPVVSVELPQEFPSEGGWGRYLRILGSVLWWLPCLPGTGYGGTLWSGSEALCAICCLVVWPWPTGQPSLCFTGGSENSPGMQVIEIPSDVASAVPDSSRPEFSVWRAWISRVLTSQGDWWDVIVGLSAKDSRVPGILSFGLNPDL